MSNYYKYIFILLTGLTYSCNSNNYRTDKTVTLNDTTIVQKTDNKDIYTLLTSHMSDTVTLDRFLDKITHQEKVTVLSKLTATWDNEKKLYTYSDSNYIFQLRHTSSMNSDEQEPNSIFTDRDTKISFKDFDITCYHDTGYRCEDYGFNLDNSLNDPKIIEVCGKRFLYADISYKCNGIGCGCFLTFIYFFLVV